MSSNNAKHSCEISKDKIAVFRENCGSTGWELFGFGFSVHENVSPVKIIQFSDMHNEPQEYDTNRE